VSFAFLQRWWYSVCRCVCRLGVLLLFRYRVWGREKVPGRGGALLVSNHQSFFDPVLVAAGLPRQVHYMARESLFRIPLFGWLIRSLNAFPLRLGGGDVRALREAVARLRRGELVLVFPEGTRTPDGRIWPLRRGVGLVARQAQVPVVPVVIEGAFEVWPRQRLCPRPGRIGVIFGEPVNWEEFGRASGQGAPERLREQLQALQVELRTRRLRTQRGEAREAER
jgi:1-acyl-sn-glycerol-3-phosphate acyltransferase